MTPTIWLASYPRSGSTWLRMLIANLSSTDTPADINALANGTADDDEPAIGVRFIQVHDAYKQTPNSDPLLAGRGAAGAILIVRDPRDVAPSLAAHNSSSIDEAIAFMGYPGDATPAHLQLRPRPLRWSSHIASWLEQKDIPVHLIRYEDLLLDPVTSFRRSLQFAGCATGDDVIRRAVVYSKFEQLQKQERTRGFREAHLRAGHFFRRGVAGSWRSELTAAQVARIEADHSAMMQRLGYKLSTKVGPHTSSSASPTS